MLEQQYKLYHLLKNNKKYFMLSLINIKPNAGATKTSKRLGRGNGSGK
jgi:hypothetical protein